MHLTNEQIIDQALGDRDAEAMAHIDACALCRDEYQSYCDTLALVRDHLPKPPEGYADMIWSRIEPHLIPPRSWWWRRRRMALIRIAATLAVACIAALLAWRAGHTPAALPPAPSAEELRKSGVERLAATARTAPSPEARIAAIRTLGELGGAQASERLVSLYGVEHDVEVRRNIVFALAVHQDKDALHQIAAAETDPELQKLIHDAITAGHPELEGPALTHHQRPR